MFLWGLSVPGILDNLPEKRTEEVDILVDGIALNGWEAKLIDEFSAYD